MSVTKKCIACLLVLSLLLTLVAPPKASAEPITLTISIVAAIFIALAATYGISLTYSQASGQSVLQWMEGRVQAYMHKVNATLLTIGAAYWRSGQWVLDGGLTQFANDFFSDLTANVVIGNPPISAGSAVGTFIFQRGPSSYSVSNESDYIAWRDSYVYFRDLPAPYSLVYNASNSRFTFLDGDIVLGRSVNTMISSDYNSTPFIDVYFFTYSDQFFIYLGYLTGSNPNYPYQVIQFIQFYDSDVFTSSIAIPTTYSPSSIPQTDYGTGVTYTGAPTGSYEDWITGVGSGAADGTLDAAREADVPIAEPVPTVGPDGVTTWDDGSLGFWDGLTGTISAGLTAAGFQVGAWVSSITAPITAAVEGVQEWTDTFFDVSTIDVSDFSVPNLQDYFPFCIPRDIYDMLNLFAGSATAPVINWRIYAPNIVDYELVLDFSVWNDVALILRRVELIAFAVGLAFATKRLIGGGGG